MKRPTTPFKDFKTKHKIYITVTNMVILLAGAWVFLSYTKANPDQEVTAGIIVFGSTTAIIFFVMLAMANRFQKYYQPPSTSSPDG